MRGKFPRGELGDGRECNPGIAIDAVFKGHDQPVVQDTVEQYRPTGQWGVTQPQIKMHQTVEFLKNDVNHDGVRIAAIDSGRKNQIEAKPAKLFLIPAKGLVGEVPQQKIQQMRARQCRDPVPDCFSGRRGRRGSFVSNSFEITDRLRINMYFAAVLAKEMLDLLDNTPLRAVLTVQKWRHDRDAQFKPAWARPRALR